MVTAETISNYFLVLSEKKYNESLSNMKVQKLVYYAQGFHLALYDTKLFNEKINAWAHGPVIDSLYHKYKQYGSASIIITDEVNFEEITEQQKELLEQVYAEYGQFSAWRLRNMTHEEEPWKETKLNEEITVEKLKSYFTTLIE